MGTPKLARNGYFTGYDRDLLVRYCALLTTIIITHGGPTSTFFSIYTLQTTGPRGHRLRLPRGKNIAANSVLNGLKASMLIVSQEIILTTS